MAYRYLRSTDGNDADGGTTWALAKATMGNLCGGESAGDVICVSQAHAESTTSCEMNLSSTTASPTKVLCVNDSAEPPTAESTGASLTTTGANRILIFTSNGGAYVKGLSFQVGTGASGASFTVDGAHSVESCTIALNTTSGSSKVSCQNGPATFRNCSFKFGASGQSFVTTTTGARVNIIGGSVLSGGTSPTNLITFSSASPSYNIEGFDLSNCGSTMNIFSTGCPVNARGVLRDCKLPASWSGSLSAGTPDFGAQFEMFNCDSGDTNYRYRKAAQFGTIQDETTLVRTGGGSDGTTGISYKMVTNSNAEFPIFALDSMEHAVWNDTTGSAVTLTVHILRDSATNLKDDEVWLEATYLGTSGYPLGSLISDAKSDVLATATDQTASSETWTTTGMANPNEQQLSVTFTPQEKGYIRWTVRVAKASTTLYYCPKPELS